MNFVKPTEIIDSLFFGSNIPENEYSEWSGGVAYAEGEIKQVTTSNTHKIFECLVGQTSGITPGILDEDGVSIADWTDDCNPGASVTIDPAGQIKFSSGSTSTLDEAAIKRTIASPPDLFTLEIKTYLDNLEMTAGYKGLRLTYGDGSWTFAVRFAGNGLWILKAAGALGEVGADIVKCNTTAAWQTWRFQVNKTTPSAATVEVFLKEDGGAFVSQGTVDCNYEPGTGTDGEIRLYQMAITASSLQSHIKYIKMATGNSAFETINDTPVDNSDWLEISNTNRWKCFDGTLASQSEQASSMTHILTPGIIDSIAILNLESTTVDIYEIDDDDDLVTNGEVWTGAIGTTQPNSWNKVGTPTDFTIDSSMIRITVDAANEGISQTIAVSAATEYQLVGKYKNTSGDIAQIAIYDATHFADIVATTDMASNTVDSVISQVFTTPAGCTSVRISLMGKTNGDIVWFGYIKLAPTEYSENITTGTSKTDLVKLDIPQKANGVLTVVINNSGGTARAGEIIVGVKTAIGTMRYSPQVGIIDYSTKTVDVFGNYSIVKRTYAKRMTCALFIPNTIVDEVVRILTLYRQTPLVWIGSENYNSLIVYGFYKSFQVVFSRPLSSDCSLEVEGLV